MTEKKESLNFIEQFIEEDIANGKHTGRVHTRFPPEPNGYLHIGHAKSIVLNFGLGKKYNGLTNLRFDDTNPTTEETEYVNSIKEDIKWLGFQWDEELYTSDYFEELYQFAVKLIKKGKAYVDDSTSEEMAALKGTPTKSGTDSPFRSRSVEENLDLFARMKAGEFEDGTHILRAKIDMSSSNMLLRDPIMYRIKHQHHHRTGDDWCIYPIYDFAHGQSDSIEEITHSICTLEFENHRPLYDWFIKELDIFPSRQIEFARLNLSYTMMSKRKLLQLVQENLVEGWDDPRMPTISGLRRRGYTPLSIRNFAERIGIAKRENMIDVGLLEFSVREDLNQKSDRVMGVLDPLKVVITNYPEGKTEELIIENNPNSEEKTTRIVPFSREIYIEKEDFMEDAPKKFFRMSQGRNTRLKGAYILHCEDVVKDDKGEILEVHCTYYPESKSGQDTSGVKAKGVLHWVSIQHAIPAEIRLYDRLFTVENPLKDKEIDFRAYINKDSLTVMKNAQLEPSLQNKQAGDQFQFMRKGYFCVDKSSTKDQLIFNRTVTLKDGWGKSK